MILIGIDFTVRFPKSIFFVLSMRIKLDLAGMNYPKVGTALISPNYSKEHKILIRFECMDTYVLFCVI